MMSVINGLLDPKRLLKKKSMMASLDKSYLLVKSITIKLGGKKIYIYIYIRYLRAKSVKVQLYCIII